MNKYSLTFCFAVAAIFACNTPADKKVLIMSRGAITITGNDITVKDGSGYTEETVDVSAGKTTSWNVTTPSGKRTVAIPEEKGFYVLNLKTDTIVGSEQIIGRDISSTHVITQEELKMKIDSLAKLTAGANISSAGHNFIILPSELKKITDNTEAKIFGPFNKMPSTLETDKNGKAPELYKFYTNNEMRELISSFKKMTY